MSDDRSENIAEQVSLACAEGRPLAIAGGGSKAFYGNAVEGEPLKWSLGPNEAVSP